MSAIMFLLLVCRSQLQLLGWSARGAQSLWQSVSGGGSASRGEADERGITLQTLIITAVVVLLAVVVGVVIIAVTGNSSDDLEETAPEVPGHCTSVEIYDPVVASRNEKGVNIAQSYRYGAVLEGTTIPITNFDEVTGVQGYGFYEFEGSAIGCIPVCVWRDGLHSETRRPNGFLEPGEVVFVRDLREKEILIRRSAWFGSERGHDNPHNNYVMAEGSTKEEMTAYASLEGLRTDELIPYAVHLDARVVKRTMNEERGTHHAGRVGGGVYRVAVSPNQKECLTYDEYGNVLFADS